MSTQPPHVEPPQPEQETPYHASAVVVPRLPDECAFSLREDEFKILCEGDVSELRAGRDLYIGLLAASLTALIGALYTTDWDVVWQPGHRKSLAFLAVLIALSAGSAVGAIINQRRLKHTLSNSAYSRLVKRIKDFFQDH